MTAEAKFAFMAGCIYAPLATAAGIPLLDILTGAW